MPYTDEFLRFWKAYPRKVNKGTAAKAWKKRGDASLETILAALETAKGSRQWLKDGGDFIPHPATWLNARGWEDEPDEAEPYIPLSKRPKVAAPPPGHPADGRRPGEWTDNGMVHVLTKSFVYFRKRADGIPVGDKEQLPTRHA